MYKVCVPSTGVKDWQSLLADPEKHWKTGHSAKAMAYSWEEAEGFPEEIKQMFISSGDSRLAGIEPLLIIPEHKVPLPGGTTESQNDAFVLARTADSLVTITVEGKVSEPFGPTLGEWYKNPSRGKKIRLDYLLSNIGIKGSLPEDIRYQLIHRTASAVIEAKQYHSHVAVMLVHSFSQVNEWFDDYASFVALYGKKAAIGELIYLTSVDGISLYVGWAKGHASYLMS